MNTLFNLLWLANRDAQVNGEIQFGAVMPKLHLTENHWIGYLITTGAQILITFIKMCSGSGSGSSREHSTINTIVIVYTGRFDFHQSEPKQIESKLNGITHFNIYYILFPPCSALSVSSIAITIIIVSHSFVLRFFFQCWPLIMATLYTCSVCSSNMYTEHNEMVVICLSVSNGCCRSTSTKCH